MFGCISKKAQNSNVNVVAAAKAALRRKKGYEKNLEQTTAQITQLEQQIYSIEAANINQETLHAMKVASAAMSQIHKGLTIDKVDETMYFFLLGNIMCFVWGSFSDASSYRDQIQQQHQLSEEIAQAIASNTIGEVPDETELEEELESMEQEAMDKRMLTPGTVPVADKISALPSAANGERMSLFSLQLVLFHSVSCQLSLTLFFLLYSQIQTGSGRRRGSRVGKASCRDGHGMNVPLESAPC